MCSGAQFIVKQNADTVCNACKMQIQFAMRANADKFANAMYTLVRCELNVTQFLSNECPCSQNLCEEAELGHKTKRTGHVSGDSTASPLGGKSCLD